MKQSKTKTSSLRLFSTKDSVDSKETLKWITLNINVQDIEFPIVAQGDPKVQGWVLLVVTLPSKIVLETNKTLRKRVENTPVA